MSLFGGVHPWRSFFERCGSGGDVSPVSERWFLLSLLIGEQIDVEVGNTFP